VDFHHRKMADHQTQSAACVCLGMQVFAQIMTGENVDLFRHRLERFLRGALPWEISAGTSREKGKKGNAPMGEDAVWVFVIRWPRTWHLELVRRRAGSCWSTAKSLKHGLLSHLDFSPL